MHVKGMQWVVRVRKETRQICFVLVQNKQICETRDGLVKKFMTGECFIQAEDANGFR